MKIPSILLTALVLPSAAFAQGDLTPPGGAPVAGMKSLAQVEPRTDVLKLAASPPYSILAAGSYYLTGNISVATGNAINIGAAGVTLDLNGFSITSANTGGNGTAISLSAAARNATIRNGIIYGGTTLSGSTYTSFGFLKGIDGTLTTATTVERVSFGGMAGTAIDCSNAAGSSASYCTVRIARLSGIIAENVDHCTVVDAGNYGIAGGVIASCRVNTTPTTGFGAIAGSGTVSDCNATSGTGNAIEGKSVSNSYGISTSSGNGIVADNVTNSTGTSISGIGIVGQNVNGCTGSTTTGIAGISSEPSPNFGITISNGTVNNSKGSTNTGSFGIFSGTVGNTVGTSGTGTGIYALNSVNNSTGRGSSSTYAITSPIAIGCRSTGAFIFAGVKQFCSEQP